MKQEKLRKILHIKSTALLSSAVSGMLTAAAFSFEKLWFLAFFSLIPLLREFLILEQPSRRKISGMIFIYMLAYYIPLLLWIFKLNSVIELEIGNFSEIAIVLSILLIACAMGLFMLLAFLPYPLLSGGATRNIAVFSFLFILGEWLQGILPEASFPWGRIGVILSPFTPYIQSANLLGTLFLSLITVMINGFLALWLRDIKRPAALLAAMGIFFSNTAYGAIREHMLAKNASPDQSALLLQGNYSGLEKWSSDSRAILESYLDMARENIDESISVVVMPESAIPVNFFADDYTRDKLCTFAIQNNVTILMGIFNKTDSKYYNSMIAIYPDGTFSKPYHKQRLVPIGEYLPYSEIITKLVPKISELLGYYSPGTEAAAIETPAGKIGGIICYESIYPQIVRENVEMGGELLVVISNDSWFNDSPALREHHAHSILRAVENNRYLLRCSSTAITSSITPWGEVTKTAPMLERAAIRVNYSLKNEKSLYSMAGDIILIPAVLMYLGALAVYTKNIVVKNQAKKDSQQQS